jgi:hypothetical protein
METTDTWSTVIDAVLQLDPREGTFTLIVYNADESEAASFDISAVTRRAALLEATAWLKGKGWDPVGTWETETLPSGDDAPEAVRKFRKARS